MVNAMSTVRGLLDVHEKSLVERIKTLREEIVPLEQELFEVRLAKGVLQKSVAAQSQPQLALANPRMLTPQSAASKSEVSNFALTTDRTRSPYSSLTIKQLVLKALQEHFPHGATANDMLHLFANVWGRGDIIRTSLSPQLSRLKEDDGMIIRKGHTWFLRHPRADEKAATDQ
jgi:hypothetical protein